jgi:hypothetical protein
MNSSLGQATPGEVNPTLGFYYAGSNVPLPEASVTTYAVTYDANGGTGSQTDVAGPYSTGSPVTVLNAGTMAYAGLSFNGWNTAADGSGTVRQVGSTFLISADATLYAQWSSAVSLEANGSFDLDSTTTTFSVNAPIYIRMIVINATTTAGSFVLKEGVDVNGLADASGETIAQGYVSIGKAKVIEFGDEPFYASKGLKLSVSPTGAKVRVILA